MADSESNDRETTALVNDVEVTSAAAATAAETNTAQLTSHNPMYTVSVAASFLNALVLVMFLVFIVLDLVKDQYNPMKAALCTNVRVFCSVFSITSFLQSYKLETHARMLAARGAEVAVIRHIRERMARSHQLGVWLIATMIAMDLVYGGCKDDVDTEHITVGIRTYLLYCIFKTLMPFILLIFLFPLYCCAIRLGLVKGESPGISESDLETLDSHKYNITEDHNGECESCAICLCEFEADEIVRTLQCSHCFHKDCVDPWLLKHDSCPTCRAKMFPASTDSQEQEQETVSGDDRRASQSDEEQPLTGNTDQDDDHSQTSIQINVV